MQLEFLPKVDGTTPVHQINVTQAILMYKALLNGETSILLDTVGAPWKKIQPTMNKLI